MFFHLKWVTGIQATYFFDDVLPDVTLYPTNMLLVVKHQYQHVALILYPLLFVNIII